MSQAAAFQPRLVKPGCCTRCGHDPEAERMRFTELMGHMLPAYRLPPADQALMAYMTPAQKRAVRHLFRSLGLWLEAVERTGVSGPWELVVHTPPILRPDEDLPVEVFPPRRALTG